MADKDKMSIADILAACRNTDGDGSAAPSDAPAENAPAAPESKPKPAAPAKSAGEMSVADMLAAARGADGGGSAAASSASADEKPAAAAPKKKPGAMSVEEMLAAARGADSGAKAKPAAAKPAAAKAAPKAAPKAGAKASPKGAAAPARSGPRDTSSILAAARSASKPGPMSKAEAAAQAKGGEKGAKAKPVLPPMPEKPAYAKMAAPAAAKAGDDRRGFFSSVFNLLLGSFLAIGFVTISGVGALWTLGLARFFFPNVLIEPPSRFKIGFPTDFAPDTVDAKFKAQFGIWVTNVEFDGQRQIVALKTVCTHLGCTPNWLEAEQKFKCPCHGSGFYKDGINFEGPAPRPLERYSIRLADDGQLEVDKSKIFQEEMGQWKDSASFVAV